MTAKQVRDMGMYLLGLVAIAGTFWLMIKLFGNEVPAGNRDAIMLGFGIILGSYKDVFGYFYGSSKGSADKSETMAAPKGPNA